MGDVQKPQKAFQAEIEGVLVFLNLGAAEAVSKSGTAFHLKRKGTEPYSISAEALAYMARKGWITRDGNVLQLSDKAPFAGLLLKQNAQPFELMENGRTRIVSRVAVESPIDYLASRKDKNGKALLERAEWSAGDRLRTDFTRANMLPSIGMRWGEPVRVSGGSNGGANITETAMAARMRVDKALEAVGPEFSGLLIDVCCFLKGLEQVEMERGWPQRSAKVMLRAGLSILARHYTPPVKAPAQIRSWGGEDYRPSL